MLLRLMHHLGADLSVGRRFPRRVLEAIERTVREQEMRHSAQLRFAIEGGLPAGMIFRRVDARTRAVEVFARLGVWDTEHNSGVLLYVLLGDRAVEIVADRGIGARVGQEQWEAICRQMQRDFAEGEFERGALSGITSVGDLLAAHFPPSGAHANELPDRPALL